MHGSLIENQKRGEIKAIGSQPQGESNLPWTHKQQRMHHTGSDVGTAPKLPQYLPHTHSPSNIDGGADSLLNPPFSKNGYND